MSTDRRQPLLDAAIQIARSVHPDRVRKLADRVRTTTPNSLNSHSLNWVGSKTLLEEFIDAWRISSIQSEEIAGILIGAIGMQEFVSAHQSIELVWTGPPSAMVPTRRTEQALLEVIGSAKQELFITSFVAYKADAILRALRKALEKGVRVLILLELSEEFGGGVSFDTVKSMREALPEARVLTWEEKADKFHGGKVHAKVAVADFELCFLSSANLTEHAMERNMEAGLLIKGGSTPKQLHVHLKSLLASNVIR